MVNRPRGDSHVLACFEPLAKTLAIAVEKSADGVARVPANDAVSECAGRWFVLYGFWVHFMMVFL